MPKVYLNLPHALGIDEAKRRVSHLVAETRQEFGHMITNLQESWTGNVETFGFRAMGFAVSGTIEVQPAAVVIDMHLPLAALPFKRDVENKLRQHATAMLA